MTYYVEEDPITDSDKKRTIEVAKQTERVSIEEFRRDAEEYFRVLLESAWRNCPFKTGTLRSSIRLEDAQGILGNPQGWGGGQTVREAEFGKVLRAGGSEFINPVTGRGCDYAEFVHDGHFDRAGNFVPPNPFLDKAIMEGEAYLEQMWEKYGDKIGTMWERD